MSAPDLTYHSKNRIVAVDMTRLLAATIVMYVHLVLISRGSISQHIGPEFAKIFGQITPIFFVLSGYFVCKNITWKKAFYNAWWTLAPFMLWNFIAIVCVWPFSLLGANHNFWTLHGIQAFVIDEWYIFSDFPARCLPINGPLWFMRDLMVFFLLSPLLAKWAKYIFPACILASFIPELAPYFHVNYALCSLRAISFFTAGCYLRTLSESKQKFALQFYSPCFIIGYLAITVADVYFLHIAHDVPSLYLIRNMLGMWTIYQIARWIEDKCPKIKPVILKFAPVTFLTFAFHMIVYTLLLHAINNYFPAFRETDWVLLLPVCCAGGMAGFFFALKRWCPCLLHLVAHYKLRPDDLKPEAANSRLNTPFNQKTINA